MWLSGPSADYQLLVYGSLTFDEGYVKKCRALIVELDIGANVELRGLGRPTDVLSRGWCYLQVSPSLPRSLPLPPPPSFFSLPPAPHTKMFVKDLKNAKPASRRAPGGRP